MKVEWRIAVYIGISTGVGVILLVTIFLLVRYHMRKAWAQKKAHANGIMGHLNLPSQIPEFTIPLMLPMFVQSKLEKEEESEVFDPVKQTSSRAGTKDPLIVHPSEDYIILDNEEANAGPVIRRLESVMDVSMFPDQENDENRPEVTGPWTSTRRESLFFPYLLPGKGSVRSTSTGSESPASAPTSPIKLDRRCTERLRTSVSNTPSPDQLGSSIRPRMYSDASDIAKQKRTKPMLVKKTSCPESAMMFRPPLKKWFGDHSRRQLSTDSLFGVKSSADLPASKRGNLTFSMKYNEHDKKLIVHLINATDLPMKNNNLLDTFARLYLSMPSKQLRQHGKVMRKTCNPIYDEVFVFDDINDEELLQSHLRIKIMHKDGFTRGEMIGELTVSLCNNELLTGEMLQRSLLPRARSITEDGAGELLVSVCHHAITAQLKVLVIKMRDLPKSTKNPSVSVELVCQDELIERKQTRSKKHRKKTVFNEELVFHIPTSSSNPLENYSLQFSIFTQDILKGAVCIGYVTLGLDAPRESEVEHWKSVVSSPHKPNTAMHKFHSTPV